MSLAAKRKESGDLLQKEFIHSRVLRVSAVIAISAIVLLILAGLFAPGIRYSLVAPIETAVDSQAFLNELEPLVNSKITHNNQFEVIDNGENFYEAEVEAMRQARHSINVEAYIFHKGRVTDQVLNVLIERAGAGPAARLIIMPHASAATMWESEAKPNLVPNIF